jgi:ABC-type transport system substrate-binding protein
MSPWNPSTKQADITQAKQLLSAAGFNDGAGIDFGILNSGTGAWADNALRIKDQLQKVFPAMKVSIDTGTDIVDFNRRLGLGDYDTATYASGPPYSVFGEAALHYASDGGRNYTKWNFPEVDALIKKAATEFDGNTRAKIAGELQGVLKNHWLMGTIGQANGVQAVQPNVRGFQGFGGPGTMVSVDPQHSSRQLWIE